MDLKRSFNRFRALIRRGNIFVSHDIWAINRENLTSWKSRLVRDFQVIITTMRSFKERGIGFQSVALSYFCTMAFVPLVAACIGLTNAFGLENQLHEIVNNFLGGEQQEVIDFVINAAEVILEEASSGIFGIISALMFIWLVIWMMNRVEVVFNNVWKVEEKTRKFYHSYGVDIIILFLIPFVILIFGAGGIVYTDVLDLVFKDFPVSEIKTFFGLIMLALISIAYFLCHVQVHTEHESLLQICSKRGHTCWNSIRRLAVFVLGDTGHGYKNKCGLRYFGGHSALYDLDEIQLANNIVWCAIFICVPDR